MIRTLIALVAFTWMTVTGAAAADRPIPRIEGRQLIVDGAPWLLLGGELANSSASSRAYMAPRWERLAGLNLNTVLVPVSWELIEPDGGRVDFALDDGLPDDEVGRASCRERRVH